VFEGVGVTWLRAFGAFGHGCCPWCALIEALPIKGGLQSYNTQ